MLRDEARSEDREARLKIERLEVRLQAAEDILDRLYKSEMRATVVLDQTARDMTQGALDRANAAQACCDANAERINRMYQKILSE